MNKCIDFVVMGEPVAKQRPRVSTFNGYARAYTPKDTINYENKVLNCYLDKLKELNIPKETPYFDRNDLLYVKINIYFTLTKPSILRNEGFVLLYIAISPKRSTSENQSIRKQQMLPQHYQ